MAECFVGSVPGGGLNVQVKTVQIPKNTITGNYPETTVDLGGKPQILMAKGLGAGYPSNNFETTIIGDCYLDTNSNNGYVRVTDSGCKISNIASGTSSPVTVTISYAL